MTVEQAQFLNDKELAQEIWESSEMGQAKPISGVDDVFMAMYSQPHNTINRMIQTTKGGMFSPFSVQNFSYIHGLSLAVFVLLDPEATGIERVRKAFERIGAWGYGRDASTGMGRFSVLDATAITFPKMPDANALYTLAPSIPEKGGFKKIYFSTFVRFGKHGDRLACSRNPFKNPVVLADEGAVLILDPKNRLVKPYVGTVVRGVSKVEPEAVVQGYAPYFPIKLEL